MAEGHRMTAAELVDKLLADEHADVLRDSVAWLVTQLMETEVGALAGAELGERERELEEFDAVLVEESNPVSRVHAGCCQRVSETARARVELRERRHAPPTPRPLDERRRRGPPGRLQREVVREVHRASHRDGGRRSGGFDHSVRPRSA